MTHTHTIELTAKQAEVLRLLGEGMGIRRIAGARGLSEGAIQTQIRALHRKGAVKKEKVGDILRWVVARKD